MRSFQDTFETRKRSFIRAFSVSMTVPLNVENFAQSRFYSDWGNTNTGMKTATG